jgi:hypothetical protein
MCSVVILLSSCVARRVLLCLLCVWSRNEGEIGELALVKTALRSVKNYTCYALSTNLASFLCDSPTPALFALHVVSR